MKDFIEETPIMSSLFMVFLFKEEGPRVDNNCMKII